jgi:hypothetical protein
MKKLSRQSVLLFGAVLAVCAFAVPSMASAASWAGLGTHQLSSNNLAFTATIAPLPAAGWSCADTEFDADVVSGAVVEITAARFRNCDGTLLAAGCTMTVTGNDFPWTATARTTSDIQIHRVDMSVIFHTRPAAAPGSCVAEGVTARVTGTLTSGSWDSSAIPANRRLTLNDAPGLTSHLLGIGLSGPTSVTGVFRDTTNTLNVSD